MVISPTMILSSAKAEADASAHAATAQAVIVVQRAPRWLTDVGHTFLLVTLRRYCPLRERRRSAASRLCPGSGAGKREFGFAPDRFCSRVNSAERIALRRVGLNSATERNDGEIRHSAARVSDGGRRDGRCCRGRRARTERGRFGADGQCAEGIGWQGHAGAVTVAKFRTCRTGARIESFRQSRSRNGRGAWDRPRDRGRTGGERGRHCRGRYRRTRFSRVKRGPRFA